MNESAGHESRIFRYAADRRAFAIVAIGLGLTVAPYLYFGAARPTWYFFPLWFVVQAVVGQLCGGIEHNHCHVKVSRSKVLNAVFSGMLSLAMGRPATYLVIPHNLNHHAEFGTDADWSDPRVMREPRNFWAVVAYSWRSFWMMTFQGYRRSNRKIFPWIIRRVAIENAMVVAWSIFLATQNPWIYFAATLPGYLLSIFGLLSINLFQHAFCDLESFHDNSRNFVSPIYNFLSCNNGYHTYHHSFPMVHWSRLPEMHRLHIDPKIRPDLNCRSYLKWAFWDFYRVERGRPIVDSGPGGDPAVSA